MDNVTGMDNNEESGFNMEARYFLVIFIMISLLFSDIGNIFLTINLFKTKRKNVTAKIISVMSAAEIGFGLFSVLPACITIIGQEWFFGSTGCMLQGLLSTVFLYVNCFFMLLLSLDRIYVVANKRSPKCMVNNYKEIVAITILLSGLLASIPLLKESHYTYIPGLYQCDLALSSFTYFISLLAYVIPYMIVFLLSIISLEKAAGCRNNRVVALDGERLPSTTRPSLIPTETTIGAIESCHLSKAEQRTTVALSYLTIPMSVLYLTAFVLKSFDKYETLTNTSLALHALASFVQPFILFVVSTALRTSFVQLFTRKTEVRNGSPIFQVSRHSPHPRDDGIDRDIPTFLRNPSSMTIRLQVSSDLNLKENLNTDDARLSSVSSVNSDNKADNGLHVINTKHQKFEVDRRYSLQSTNGESVDSLFVNFDASVDNPSRWSVSTASVMTLSIPDKQMTCTKSRSRLSRVMSEKLNDKHEVPLSPTGSINSELILRTNTLPAIGLVSPKVLGS